CKAVALPGRIPAAKHSSATSIASAATARAASRPAAERAARHRPAGIAGGAARFFAESKSLAKAHVQRETRRTAAAINGNLRRSSCRLTMKTDIPWNRAVRDRIRECGLKLRIRRTIGKQRIVIGVNARGDVERNAGTRDQKRTDAQPVRKSDRTAKKKPLAYIKIGAAIV